eukprot:Sspe_Gene.28503::Locus_12981_Transcript_1_1_Confidence_1.000_Length_2891::g.28503::m.28503/K14792/RRP5, PDCD11; rRNA biogenesis protein RRP5
MLLVGTSITPLPSIPPQHLLWFSSPEKKMAKPKAPPSGKKAKKLKKQTAEEQADDEWYDDGAQASNLQEWASSDEEGGEVSKEELLQHKKNRFLSKTVISALPISRVLCKKGERSAYAIITDLGEGLEGFLAVSEMVDDPSVREALSQRLSTVRPVPPPTGKQHDRRLRVRHVAVEGEGQNPTQLKLTGKMSKIAASLRDGSLDNLSAPVKALAQRLFDRDRLAQHTQFHSMAIGLLMDGVVQSRSTEGLVFSLSNPWNTKQRNLIGVAVGSNAQLPGQEIQVSPSLSSLPGTPNSLLAGPVSPSSSSSCVQCRVLDFDPIAGFVDVACAAYVTHSAAATDKKMSAAAFKSLKKRIGHTIPCQVVLRKPDYAIVISRPFSGALAYLPIEGIPPQQAQGVKAGARLNVKVEFVRMRPLPPPKRIAARWEKIGRAFQEEEEDRLEKYLQREQRAPGDIWLCPEPFAIVSLPDSQVPPEPVVPATPAPETPAKAEPSTPGTPKATPTTAPAPAPEKRSRPAIEVPFAWKEEANDADHSGDEAMAPEKKKRKKKKKAEESEVMIDEIERARRDGTGGAKTVEDFERMVMSSPHSSYVWCQFMAHYVASKEYEQARLVAERALKTISYRETEELFNVWVAYLNIENAYGTQESLNEVFARFLKHSDDEMKAYSALVDVAKSTNHAALVHRTFQTMLKKFGQSTIKPWVDYAQFLIQRGSYEELGRIQKRMLSNENLSPKHHVAALVKIACLHFREGSIDKGRNIFESLVIKYPKRTDLWSVYLDMEQVVLPKVDDLSRIRHVFDRVITTNLSTKKMQYFLSRYMAFETQHGTQERVDYVKQKAVEYVNARMGEE